MLLYGDDVFQLGGDFVIYVLSMLLIMWTNTIFVGRRKTTTSIVPMSSEASSLRQDLPPPQILSPKDEAKEAGTSGGAQDQDTSITNTHDRTDHSRDEASGSRALLSTVTTLLYIVLYVFALVPLFSTWSDEGQFLFRILVHPLIVLTGEMVLREVAAMPSSQSPIVKCTSVMGYDIYFQLVGRLLVASQTDPLLMNVTVIVIGMQELMIRTTYLPKKRWIRRRLYGLPPMTAEEEGRFLGVLAIDNVSSMQVDGGVNAASARTIHLLTVLPSMCHTTQRVRSTPFSSPLQRSCCCMTCV